VLGGTGTANCGEIVWEPDAIAPLVPFVLASPTIKGVVVFPPWRIVIAPPPVPLALEMLTSTLLRSLKMPLTVSKLPAVRSILPPVD
jgi:hypothetical protein